MHDPFQFYAMHARWSHQSWSLARASATISSCVHNDTNHTSPVTWLGMSRGYIPSATHVCGRRSHIWSTGQDQCAIIKRQLQLLLPGVIVFLDIDDLGTPLI